MGVSCPISVQQDCGDSSPSPPTLGALLITLPRRGTSWPIIQTVRSSRHGMRDDRSSQIIGMLMFRSDGLGPFGSILAIAALLFRLAVSALAPIVSSPDAFSGLQAGHYSVEICRHSETSSADGQPDFPAPWKNRAHDCMACCVPAGLAGIAPQEIKHPIGTENCVDRPRVQPRLAAPSFHVVRQRGPPPV